MFLHTRGNGQHIGVEDDIERVHAYLVHKDAVGTLRYFYAALVGSGLSYLVEAHHHTGGSVTHDVSGMGDKHLLAFLQGNRVDNTLALHTFQAGKDDLPFRGVDHDRHLGNLWFCRYHVEKMSHLCLGIQQSVIHIDIDHRGSVRHLLACYTQRFLIILFINQTKELPATSYVTAFSNVNKATCVNRQLYAVVHLQEVQSRQPHTGRFPHPLMWFLSLRHYVITGDEIGSRSATSADDVDDALVDELGDFRSHTLCRLVILTHLIGQSCVGMGTNIIRCHLRQVLNEGFHLRSAEGAVHAHGEDGVRRETCQKCVHCLSAERSARQVTYGETDHNGQFHAVLRHGGERCVYHCLAVERIKDGFDEDYVNAPLDESVHLLAHIGKKFIVGDFPDSRVADIGAHGAGLVGGTHVTCHETRFLRGGVFVALNAC